MNLPFPTRRDVQAFADAIRPELQSLPSPAPRQELLARILASRESGLRVILPDSTPEPGRHIRFIAIAAAIAAALLLVVIPRDRSRDASAEDTWASHGFFGDAAFARTPTAAPAFPPIRFSRADRLRPGSMQYVRRLRDRNGTLIRELGSELSLTPAVLDGQAAWKIIALDHDVRTTQIGTETETLYVARSDLRMLTRAVHVAPYRRFQRINIQQRFVGDSVTGRMTTDGPSIGAGRPIARKLAHAFEPYLSDAFAPLLFMSVPLDPDWRGSGSMLGWAVIPNDVAVPVSLRVEGEERIQVPAGTFDCWRVRIDFGKKHISFWVRKSDGLGVRVYDESNVATTGSREIVLRSVR